MVMFGFKWDYSYFIGMKKRDVISLLAKKEKEGKLAKFIGKVAPDYVEGSKVYSFKLAKDLGVGKAGWKIK